MRAPALFLVAALLMASSAIPAADATAATSNNPPLPPPSASATTPTLDDATLARANAAADAYAKSVAAARTPASQAAQDAIAAAELNILEAGTYLDQNDVTRAGDCYLAARKLLKDLPDADKPLLGARLTADRDAVAVLSQRMLAADKRSTGELTGTGAAATDGPEVRIEDRSSPASATPSTATAKPTDP